MSKKATVIAGRQLKGGTFDLSNVWSRRNAVLNDDVKSKAKVFSIERNEPFAGAQRGRLDGCARVL